MKKFTKYLLIMLCLPLLLVGCKNIPKLENGEEVIAELNGKQFTARDLYDEMKDDYGTASLISLIDQYITDQEATDDIISEAKEAGKADYDSYYAQNKDVWSDFLTRYGFKNDTDFADTLINNYKQSLVVKEYLKTTITDKEIEDYYKEDIYGEITARHILLIPYTSDEMTTEEKSKAKEESLKQAKELIKTLKESDNLEETFISLAKEKSNDTGSASQGGLISNFTNESGLVKEFWEASLKLKTGELTNEPVESIYGYHVIYKVGQNEKPDLETVKDKVITSVVNELLQADNATYVYWAALREKYGLKLYDSTIEDSYKATQKGF